MFYYSRDRAGEHAQAHLADYAGIFQAGRLADTTGVRADRQAGQIVEAACWVTCPATLFQMADLAATFPPQSARQNTGGDLPVALEAVRRIDALFEIERSINASRRSGVAVRQELSAPWSPSGRLAAPQRAKLSRGNDLAKQWTTFSKRWPAFTRFSTMAGSA